MPGYLTEGFRSGGVRGIVDMLGVYGEAQDAYNESIGLQTGGEVFGFIAGPVRVGQLFVGSARVAGQTLDIATEIVAVRGGQLSVDLAIFPAAGERAAIGVRGVRQLFRSLTDSARAAGYESLHISTTRVSGARPGPREMLIDLTKRR